MAIDESGHDVLAAPVDTSGTGGDLDITRSYLSDAISFYDDRCVGYRGLSGSVDERIMSSMTRAVSWKDSTERGVAIRHAAIKNKRIVVMFFTPCRSAASACPARYREFVAWSDQSLARS